MQPRTIKTFSFQFLKIVPLRVGTKLKWAYNVAKLVKIEQSKPYKIFHIINRNLIIQIMAHSISRYLVHINIKSLDNNINC